MSARFNSEDEDLKIDTCRDGDAIILRTRGEVTVFTSPAFRETLRQATESMPPLVVLDLQETTYVDSSGVATLVEALQTVNRYKGRLVLAGMSRRVRGVFEIARLDTIFLVAADVAEALKA